MSDHINNKRIAKNTLILYVRTLFTMLISLYTSRVLLKALGVDNYGIYQVVGSFVSMFSILSASLSTAISRFITFEIGRGNKEQLKKIFSTSISIQLVISIIIIVISEIVGLWFIETKMDIPESRMYAAQFVFHCSLITFCIGLFSVPYNACIIAHEHMKAFAYVSIIDVTIKLLICYLIIIAPYDKLITYAILLMLQSIGIRFIYMLYCKKHFEESHTGISFNKTIFKEMFNFSGWAFFSNTTYILNNQGVNMLINVFFGVTLNAARGIATQVESAVERFVNNFTVALNPQITKSYAAGDLAGMHKLVCRGAKFSFFTMWLFSLPIILEAEQILNIWLVQVPEHTVIFTQLSLILGMFTCIGYTGYTACMATGNIKKYSLIITPLGLLEFPFVWIAFSLGSPAVMAYYLYVLVKFIVIVVRMFLLRDMVGLPVRMYITKVFIPITLTAATSIILPSIILHFIQPSPIRLIASIIVALCSAGITTLYIGMDQHERKIILEKIKTNLSRIKYKSK